MEIHGYKIIKPIERSTPVQVYLATQPCSDKQLAIHCLGKNTLPSEAIGSLTERFIEQGEYLCNIDHPNIAPVHDVGDTEDYLYLVTDYIPGESLATRGEQLCTLDQVYVVKQAANALDCLKEFGLAHFNIKPNNIILCEDSSKAVLIGFGFDIITEALAIAAEGRADLYSLGAIFYTLLMNKQPMTASLPSATDNQLPEFDSLSMPADRAIFQDFINRALASSAAERFTSGQEMAQALTEIDDEKIIYLNGHQGMLAPLPNHSKTPSTPQSTPVQYSGNVVPLVVSRKAQGTDNRQPITANTPTSKASDDFQKTPKKVTTLSKPDKNRVPLPLDTLEAPDHKPNSAYNPVLLLCTLFIAAMLYYFSEQGENFPYEQYDMLVEWAQEFFQRMWHS